MVAPRGIAPRPMPRGLCWNRRGYEGRRCSAPGVGDVSGRTTGSGFETGSGFGPVAQRRVHRGEADLGSPQGPAHQRHEEAAEDLALAETRTAFCERRKGE